MRQPFRPILLLTGAMAACGEPLGPIDGLPRELSVAEQRLIQSDNRFAFKLFRETQVQDTSGGNIFISPLSVAMALGMTYNGAAGETAEAMQHALELDGLALADVNASYRSLIDLLRGLDAGVEFVIANSIWYRQGITVLPDFVDLTQRFFDARVAALDFDAPDAADVINTWVREQTRGRIEEIVDKPITPDVLMHLLNAIYFKGTWTRQFDRALTAARPFQLAGGATVSADMMSQRGLWPMQYTSDDVVEVLDLPYGREAFTMTLVVPHQGRDIEDLAARLTEERWNGWIAALDSTTGTISMPRFTLEYGITLNEVLKALGMTVAFTAGEADFSKIFGSKGPWIGKVKHKTFVDVNEEGTEAAAATDVVIVVSHGGPHMVVDRPFVFAIRERLSGTILFIGKVMNPAAS